MRSGRVAPWVDEPDWSIAPGRHEFPRIPRFPRCRDGAGVTCEPYPRRPLSDDQGIGALPQPDCAWARTVWLPRVMRAPWMAWAQAVRDTLIGQIP